MTAHSDEKPWYRQFWPWFIMALPASAVVAGLSTVYIAFKNKDSLVRDDWYQDGQSINIDLTRDDHARALGIKADAILDALTGEVRLTLHGKPALVMPPSLTLVFSHVSRADLDQSLTLLRQRDGHYQGSLGRALQGRFDIELSGNGWRVTGTRMFPLQDLHLEFH
jgi:hypothetical protein